MTIGKLVEPLTRAEYVEWIKALRSGEYNQGQGHLVTKDGYCCLGVLAKIKGTLDRNGMFMRNPNSLIYTDVYGHMIGYYLPMGYPGEEEDVGYRLDQNTLMQMNDEGSTFDEIAAFIEANMPEE